MSSLRRRMTEDMQIRNLAVHTQNTYLLQVSMFARHFSKSPEVLGPEEIRTYQVYLTNEKKAGDQFDSHRNLRPALPLQNYPQEELGFRRDHSRA